jgi:hypothetical protein
LKAEKKLMSFSTAIAILTAISFSISAQAEYRSFLLQITSADGKEVKEVKSTLDPDQYRGYHPTQAGDKIVYLETWKCKGNTANVSLCKSPRELAAEGSASSLPTSP